MGAAGMRRSGARTMLFLASVLLLFMAAAVVTGSAAGEVVDGGGEAGGESSSLELLTDGGGDRAEEDDLFNWEDDDDDEEEEEEEEEDPHIMMVGSNSNGKGRNVVNVDGFGAVGDGNADDTQAFQNAWEEACSLDNAVFLVPAGRRYKVGASRFMGPCKRKMSLQIQGTIVAPEEPEEWDPRSPRLWLLFGGLVGARIEGGGVIDGSGSKWWAKSCKIDKSNPCKPAPTAVTLDSCRGVRVRRLRVQNAQQMHLTVSRSRDVRLAGLHVSAPEDSPNTDGIHIADSTGVTVQSCRIGTGDDCISISNGSFSVRMKRIDCGPGHGISIGSLGAGGSFAAVEDVWLETATVRRAQNGVRIKTWQGGRGYVRNVRFSDVRVDRVDHPIVIDQFYCDSARGRPCPRPNETDAVQVSNVVFRRISGTSTREEAIRLACSDAVPCRGVVLSDIDLARAGGEGDVQAVCNCVMGFDEGGVRPAVDCLRRSSTSCGGGDAAADEAIRHTEL